MQKILTLVLLLAFVIFSASKISAQTTAFTYQGSLKDGAISANGNYDFEFGLFDAASGGSQLGSLLTRNNVTVVNGIFSVSLDFGNQFPGANRFLEIRVRLAGQPGITILGPRQFIVSTPYSVRSLSSTTADSATSATTATNSTQLGGVAAAGYLQTTGGTITGSLTVNGTISGNGSGLTNLTGLLTTTTVTASFTAVAGTFSTGVANCPNGWQLVGGGDSVPDSVWNLLSVVQSRPVGDGVGWRVRVASGAANSVTVEAWAVCAKLN